jgi:ribosomal protein S27AE
MTINELRAIVPETLWDTPITIEVSPASERLDTAFRLRTVPVRSVKVDTSALDTIALVPEPHFLCPRCDRISFNPNDQAQRYCGACHVFFT